MDAALSTARAARGALAAHWPWNWKLTNGAEEAQSSAANPERN